MPAIAVEDLPPIFTRADARAQGISDRILYGWRDDDLIEQLARGIFVQPNLAADPDLVEIAVRAPDATLCLTTALARHHLIDDIPSTIDVALPRDGRSEHPERLRPSRGIASARTPSISGASNSLFTAIS